MSLLVLDPDIASAEKLQRQLKDLGYESLVATRSEDAVRLCLRGDIQAVLFANLDFVQSLNDPPPGVGFIYATPEPLELTTVLACLQSGINDCWQLPMSDLDMRNRLDAVLGRMEKLVAQTNAEMRALRTELERDQRAGQYVQMGMLPPNPMGIGYFRLQHRVEPSLILSGDFVDYFQITDRHFACYVADVAGHGASSAFVTVLLKNFSRRLRREYRNSMLQDPGEILSWINNELIDQQIEKHVAMFFGIVDTEQNKLHYANAAHFPPAMLIAPNGANDNAVVSLEQKGKPLGIFADAQYQSLTVDFAQGSRIVVFSDGVLDLITAPTLIEKEQQLVATVGRCEDMESLWASLDISKIGQDDVSCLMISHSS